MKLLLENWRIFLNELNIGQVLSKVDPSFIHHKEYSADRTEKNTSNLLRINKNGTLVFSMKSWEGSDAGRQRPLPGQKSLQTYRQIIMFPDVKAFMDSAQGALIDKVRTLFNNEDIKLHCTCPSQRYHYAYVANKVHDASIQPEKDTSPFSDPPVDRNRSQTGIMCKHLDHVIRRLNNERIIYAYISFLRGQGF